MVLQLSAIFQFFQLILIISILDSESETSEKDHARQAKEVRRSEWSGHIREQGGQHEKEAV